MYLDALRVFTEAGDDAAEAEVANDLGGLYHGLGDLVRAEVYYQRSLDLRSQSGDVAGEGRVQNNLGVVYAQQRRFGQAEACFRRALAVKRKTDDRVGEGQTLQNLALLSDAQGDRARAVELQELAVELLEGSRDGPNARFLTTARAILDWWSKRAD